MSKILHPSEGIVSPSGPDITITITLDTKTNATQLRANKPLNKNIVLALLLNHAKSLSDQIVLESVAPISKENGNVT